MVSTQTINAFNLCWNFLVRESELHNGAFFSDKHLKIIDTRDTNFDAVENRLAYTYKFGCYNILFAEECISNFLSECTTADSVFPFENLKVCSLSNGPGLDLVGLLCALCKSNKSLKGFPQLTAVNLYNTWLYLFKTIVQSAYEVTSLKSFIEYFHIPARNIQLIQGDVYSTLIPEVRSAIEDANVLLMFKVFASTKASSEVFAQTLKEIFSLLKPGSLIFFIGSKNNTKQFSKKSHLSQYVKCIYGPQKVTVNDVPIDEHVADTIGARPQVSGFAYFIVWQKRDALVEVKDVKRKNRRKKKKICENVVVEKDNADFVVGENKDHDSDAGSEISFSSDSKMSDSLSDEMKSDTNSSMSNSASFKVMKVSSLQHKENLSDGVAYSVDISPSLSRTVCKDSICKQKEGDKLTSTQEKEFKTDITGMPGLAHPHFETFYETHFTERKKLNDQIEKKIGDMNDEIARKIEDISGEIAKKLEDTTLTESSFFNSTDPEKSVVTAIEKEETCSFFTTKLDKSIVPPIKKEGTNYFYNSASLDKSDVAVEIDLQAPAVNEYFEKAENAISDDTEETMKKEETHCDLQSFCEFFQKQKDHIQSHQNERSKEMKRIQDYVCETSRKNLNEIKENQSEKQNVAGPENCGEIHSININTSSSDSSTDCKREKLEDLQQNPFPFNCGNVLGVVSHLQEKKLETSILEDKIPLLNNYACSFHEECDDTQSVSSKKSNNNQPQIKNERIFGENDLGFSQISTDMDCDTDRTVHTEKLKTGDIGKEIQDPEIIRLVHNFYEDIYDTNFTGEKIPANKAPPVKEQSIQENKTDLKFSKVNSISKILQSQTNAVSSQNFGLKTCEDTCNKNSEKNKFQFVVQTLPEKKGKAKKEKAKKQDELKLLKCGTSTNQFSRNLPKHCEKDIQTALDASKPDIHLFLQRCENLITSLEKLTDDIKSSISSASNGTAKCCSAKQICGTSQGSYVSGINNSCERACCCNKTQSHCMPCSRTSRNNIIPGSRATERAGPYIVIPLKNEDIIQILTSRTSTA